MTGAGAISQLTHGIPGATNVFLWVTGSEVIGMTAGAIGLVSRGRPDDGLAVAGVAVQTGNAGAMVAWVSSRTVAETDRRPVAGAMTAVTLQGCGEMPARFARRGAAVMTIGTRAGGQGVVEASR